jgi:hypothetical protein
VSVIEQNYDAGTQGATVGAGTNGLSLVGSAQIYDNTHVAHGARAVKIASVGTQEILSHTPGSSAASAATRVAVFYDAYPTGNQETLTLRSSGASACKIVTTTTGKATLQNAAGASLGTSTPSMPLSTWLLYELWGTEDTTVTGECHGRVTSLDGSTVYWTLDATAVNVGTTAMASARMGKQTTVGDWTAWFDDFAIDIGRASYIGPLVVAGAVSTRWGFGRIGTPKLPSRIKV